MKKTFTYILPYKFSVPGRQTIRRDLDLLHDMLRDKINTQLQENSSKLAIASDLWTSKNSVYAFVGTVVFYINHEWKLVEHVLDLQHLPGGHTGAESGKLIFKSLRKRKIETKLSCVSQSLKPVANASDNTASNNLMNRAISKRLAKASSQWIDPVNMQVGCAAHVLNLVSQVIFHALGAAPDPDKHDLFVEARAFPLAYDPNEDEAVIEETNLMTAESKSKSNETVDAVETSDDEIVDDEDLESDQEAPSHGQPAGTRSLKSLSVVAKLHAIVVDILCSDIRRKKMCKLIRQLCDEAYKHLVLVRAMEIRWNTTYTEMDRGTKLKPAVNHWVDQLDSGLTGKKKAMAIHKKKKWHISHSEWELLERLCVVLKDFYEATLDFS
ncbi:hypothetical protein PAXRUDRAFT_22012, partial [Paxillus rubicundulus Ve08.2h10]